MKKKILFVQESLRLAGSEKSMVSLLKNLDSEKYQIDIQLMHYGGELEQQIPSWIRFLPPLEYKNKAAKSLIRSIMSVRSGSDVRYLKARLTYSLALRKKRYSHSRKAQLFWKSFRGIMSDCATKYDVAIGFAQGFPTFYVADMVTAERKLCWVNANMVLDNKSRDFYEMYYHRFDKVVCITPKTKEVIGKQIPSLTNLTVMENIIDMQNIVVAANIKNVNFNTNVVNILTVGRLNNGSKGMDIAISAAKHLKDKNVDFHWYFLGEGDFRKEMETYITANKLVDNVTLLGTDSNPYPYFKAADIYVQTSRNEGFGRTIAEARLLNIPVVTTRFDSVAQQMIHEKNGLVTDMNPQAVADGIERMITDKELYNSVVEYLKQEPKENTETVKKFDEMIEELLNTVES